MLVLEKELIYLEKWEIINQQSELFKGKYIKEDLLKQHKNLRKIGEL